MVSFILGFTILVVITVAVSSYLDLPVSGIFMTVLLSVILVLYLFSIAGLMAIGYYLLTAFSILCVAYCLVKRHKAKKNLFSSPIMVIVILFVVSTLIGRYVYTGDEEIYSYWLPGLEYILTYSRLPYAVPQLLPDDVLHPPLIWILQYFMLFRTYGTIDISLIISCNNLLAFACVLPFFGEKSPKSRYDYLLLAVKIVLIFGLLGTESGFTTLLPGRLFALLFGYGIFVALTKPCEKRYELVELSAVLSGVMLINSTGFAFSFLILIVARVVAFFTSKEQGLFCRVLAASREHFMSTVSVTVTSISFMLLLFFSGNTELINAVSSVFDALADFVHWSPYTLTVIALLMQEKLIGMSEMKNK